MNNKITQESLKEIHFIIKNFLHEGDMEDIDAYCRTLSEIDKYEIAVPKELYKSIVAFIDEHISPLVFDHKNTFSATYSPEYGTYDEDGIFCISTEEQLKGMLATYYKIIFEAEKEWDNFAMNELHPVIIA